MTGIRRLPEEASEAVMLRQRKGKADSV